MYFKSGCSTTLDNVTLRSVELGIENEIDIRGTACTWPHCWMTVCSVPLLNMMNVGGIKRFYGHFPGLLDAMHCTYSLRKAFAPPR